MKQPAVDKDWEFHTDLPVGEILRRTRAHYGQSIEDVAAILRIRARHLEAIETGNNDLLPGRVYAIGFVRTYAEYLGLDGDKMVHLLKTQTVGHAPKTELNFPVAASESRLPSIQIICGAIVGAILLLYGWSLFSGRDRDIVRDIPVVPDELHANLSTAPALPIAGETAAPAEGAVEAGADAVSPAEPVPTNRIILEIIDTSWVEIKDDKGAAILRQVLKPGDRYLVPDQKGLVISTGNAGGIKVLVDGKAVTPLGRPAQVKRNVPLDPEALLAAPPLAPEAENPAPVKAKAQQKPAKRNQFDRKYIESR